MKAIHNSKAVSKPDVIDVSPIVAEIKKQQPDVVVIQEVGMDTKRSGSADQAKQLAAAGDLKCNYFGKAMDDNEREYGVLIW